VATATHGSGDRNGNLATAVAAIELVTADGQTKSLSRGDAEFDGAVVSLGALGVVTRLTLDVIPAFGVRQSIHEGLPFDALLAHFDAVTSLAYSVSLFTDWRGDAINQVWLKRREGDGESSIDLADLGATPATRDVHPIPGMPTENCTRQMDVPGPWHERLPHFRMEFTPSSGEELQSEYFVPRERAIDALRAVNQLRDRIAPLLQISEIRTIAMDNLWMSPCYRQPCVGVHFTWKKDWPAVSALLPTIEERLAPLGARPHWGKLFTMPAEQIQSRYPRLNDFRDLMRACDPHGKFHNAFLERNILASQASTAKSG
jgi:xylitol oxidase